MASPTQSMVRACSLVSVLIAGACNPTGDTRELRGTVTRDGAPVANSQVVAMNRITDASSKTITDAEGNYSLTLEPGFYDVGANSDSNDAAIHGLVDLREGSVELGIEIPVEPNPRKLFGTILQQKDSPAANYSLKINDGSDSQEVAAVTDENGEFSLEMDGEETFDLEVYDVDGNFVEFVDLQKLSGALQVNLLLGDEEDNNVYRHDESTPDPTPVLGDSCIGDEFEYTQEEEPYECSSAEDETWPCIRVKATLDGVLETTEKDAEQRYIRSKPEDFQSVEKFIKTENKDCHSFRIWSAKDGRFWYDYAVHAEASKPGNFLFTDASGDTYSLSIYDIDTTHRVNYNSPDSAITQVRFQWFELQ